MVKYEPNTDNDIRSTTDVPLVKTQTRTVTYMADGSVVEQDPGMLVGAQAHSSRTCTTETTTVSHHRQSLSKVHISKRHHCTVNKTAFLGVSGREFSASITSKVNLSKRHRCTKSLRIEQLFWVFRGRGFPRQSHQKSISLNDIAAQNHCE